MARHIFKRKVLAATRMNQFERYWVYLECGHKVLMDAKLNPLQLLEAVDCHQCRSKKTSITDK